MDDLGPGGIILEEGEAPDDEEVVLGAGEGHVEALGVVCEAHEVGAAACQEDDVALSTLEGVDGADLDGGRVIGKGTGEFGLQTLSKG